MYTCRCPPPQHNGCENNTYKLIHGQSPTETNQNQKAADNTYSYLPLDGCLPTMLPRPSPLINHMESPDSHPRFCPYFSKLTTHPTLPSLHHHCYNNLPASQRTVSETSSWSPAPGPMTLRHLQYHVGYLLAASPYKRRSTSR